MPLVTQVIVISILCSLIMTAIVLFTLAGTSSLHSTALFKITGTQDNDPNFFFGLLGECTGISFHFAVFDLCQALVRRAVSRHPTHVVQEAFLRNTVRLFDVLWKVGIDYSFKIDLSLLHGDIASQVIKAPPTFLAVFAYLFIALQFVFLVMFFMISLCWPRWFKSLDKSWMINTTTLIGFVCTLGSRFRFPPPPHLWTVIHSLFAGLTCFSIFLLLFAETTQAFNSIMQGRSSEFTANIGNGFLRESFSSISVIWSKTLSPHVSGVDCICIPGHSSLPLIA